MKLAAGVLGALLVLVGRIGPTDTPWLAPALPPALPTELTPADLTGVVQTYCQVCHNDQLLTGNLSLQGFDVANPMAQAPVAEKMIQKLQVGMMPPPGAPRPGGDTLQALIQTLEQTMDKAARANPNPGSRSFQRLNRAEYESSIHDLLGLEISAEAYLPQDTKSANFDNIADVQSLSPTLLDAYLRAASVISRLAVGYPDASANETQYMVPRWYSQVEHVEGAPMGTRGGTSVIHNFPADGEYVFRVQFHNETTGGLFGDGRSALHTGDHPEQLEISIDGDPVALIEVDRWMMVEDITDGPTGVSRHTDSIFVRAGAHRVTAAFITRYESPVGDIITPVGWSIIGTSLYGEYGTSTLPHLRDLVVAGPYRVTGVSVTPSRERIFSCRPTSTGETAPCARQILSRLATQAFRRPVASDEIAALMRFYDEGAQEGGFEGGIRLGLEAILSSVHFVFRIEQPSADAKPGQSSRLNDFDLASRLSYFLWATPPDQELRALAEQGKLSDRGMLDAQARRMLADPRAEALATRFAAQWLRLSDLGELHPDVRFYPDYDQQLGEAMRKETELFFYNLVKNDRPFLELFTADYTFANERLAKHYGIMNVYGKEFRRVQYPDEHRRGLFGQASVLASTSVAGRTSPVLRGKWVMEVILGTPPPPPPPGVPALEDTPGSEAGRILTTRERMEQHRKAPVCKSCHRFMDPIGLALDNFDVIGQWRIRENNAPLDTRGQLYDGTPLATPGDLTAALLKRPVPILRNFTKNLMAYALGRRVEYYDMPAVREIVDHAQTDGYPMSSFILGVVNSDAFQMQKSAADPTDSSQIADAR